MLPTLCGPLLAVEFALQSSRQQKMPMSKSGELQTFRTILYYKFIAMVCQQPLLVTKDSAKTCHSCREY
jgi:hypothetical protein